MRSKGLCMALGIALVSSVIWAPSVNATAKIADMDRLVGMARQHGTVPVIVELDVPQVDALMEASIATADRDADLAAAIKSTADRTIMQLPAGWYEPKRVFRTVPYASIWVTEEGLAALESMPGVLSVVENEIRRLPEPVTQAESGNRIDQPLLQNTVKVIGADKAWAMGYTGKGWYVAILDTGILKTHEFFKGKPIQEACFTTVNATYGSKGICPNKRDEMIGPGAAKHQKTSDSGWDHGTHVSGIAAGKKSTLAGVAKDAGIIAVNVFSLFKSNDYCWTGTCVLSWVDDQIAGLEYIYSLRNTYKIASVNMSLGGGNYTSQSACDKDNSAEKKAIDNLRKVNITTVISSGNGGSCAGIGAPGCISSAVAIGATDDADREASFSDWNKSLVDIFAPGVAVYSSTGKSNKSYESWDGTSMAAPHVTGAVALMKQAKPGATTSQIVAAMQKNAKTGVKMRCGSGSKGRVQVDRAITGLKSGAPPAD